MRHLIKQTLVGLAFTLAAVGTASANSITMSFFGEGTANTITRKSSSAAIVQIFANFSNAAGSSTLR